MKIAAICYRFNGGLYTEECYPARVDRDGYLLDDVGAGCGVRVLPTRLRFAVSRDLFGLMELKHLKKTFSAHVRWCDPDFLHAASDRFACAAFCKESRMKFASATKLDRKSGGTWGTRPSRPDFDPTLDLSKHSLERSWTACVCGACIFPCLLCTGRDWT